MTRVEEGLSVHHETDPDDEIDVDAASLEPRVADADLESLRDEFVDAFNARDLEAVLALVRADVECSDRGVSDARGLGDELSAIWARSPGALLTRGFLDAEPCAVAWLPDEDGCWTRAALVRLGLDGTQTDRPLIDAVALPDDPDSLERAEADDPDGEELDEGAAWSEWDAGEDPAPHPRR